MAEPKPSKTVLDLVLYAMAGMALWFALMPVPQRQARLHQIALEEHAQSLPPTALLAQAEWLIQHRVQVGQRLLWLCGLLGMMGAVEGLRCRKRDVKQGHRVAMWAVGSTSITVLVGGLCLVGLVPIPLPLPLVSWGTAAMTGFMAYTCCLGRPTTP